jgi:hypothetical protein
MASWKFGIRNSNMQSNKNWTEEEDEYLLEHCLREDLPQISSKLDRSDFR